MQEQIIQNKVDLFIKNYEEVKSTKGSWQMGMIQYSCALSSTIKNKNISNVLIEESLEAIKNNTRPFSSIRGNFYIATMLSFKENPSNSIKVIVEICKKLKEEKFCGDTYLPYVAALIYENKDKMDVDTCISKMKYVYEFMKKRHPFLTSSDDYSNAALIAINSKDLDTDLEYIEESYESLSLNGFTKGNNLQALSHIMSFSKDKTLESCKRPVKLRNLFDENDCKMHGYGYPLIGAISLIDCNEENIVRQVKQVSDTLKEIKGFGNWVLGKQNRAMISCAIVASSYADMLQEKNNVDTITNNIFLDIIIATEIACNTAMIGAVIASTTIN